MADTAEWAGTLGFAALIGAFLGLVITVSVRLDPPVDAGTMYLGDAAIGIVAGVIVFLVLAVVYLVTLADTQVTRDELIPGPRSR